MKHGSSLYHTQAWCVGVYLVIGCYVSWLLHIFVNQSNDSFGNSVCQRYDRGFTFDCIHAQGNTFVPEGLLQGNVS